MSRVVLTVATCAVLAAGIVVAARLAPASGGLARTASVAAENADPAPAADADPKQEAPPAAEFARLAPAAESAQPPAAAAPPAQAPVDAEPARPAPATAAPARPAPPADEPGRPAPDAAAIAAEHQRPLLEMITADRRGRLYTLSAREAANAERVHGFTPTDESAGITLFDTQIDGTVPVFRLRLRAGHQAYMLSTDAREIARVSDPQDPNRMFDNEGVHGYVYQFPGDGRMELTRYYKDGDWRVARVNRADLVTAGYQIDGPLGYVPRG